MDWVLQGKVCVVTGGAGFIGSHLVERLLALGNQVIVLDNFSTGSIANLRSCINKAGFELIKGSVEDYPLVQKLVARADVVFHLAAAVGVKLVATQLVKTLEVNVRGTETVFQAAAMRGCRVVYTSSSEVYGKGSKVPFKEDDDVVLGPSTRPRWAYGASKMLGEFFAMAYHRELGLPVVCARLFNTIGLRQSGRYGMVVPRFILSALRNQPLTIYGDGLQTRCFCSVHDVIDALIGLAMHPAAAGEVFNVGSNEEITIRDLAKLIIELTGSSSRVEFVPFESAYGAGMDDMLRRVPDTSKIRAVLGWMPRVTLHDALMEIIEHTRIEGLDSRQSEVDESPTT